LRLIQRPLNSTVGEIRGRPQPGCRARPPAADPGGRPGRRCGTIGRVSGDLDPAIAAQLKRDADGLVAAVVRDHHTGEVLMLAWMDDQALHQTLRTGRATYWSRSRRRHWVK